MKLNRKHNRADLTVAQQQQLARRLSQADPLLNDANLLWRVRQLSCPPQTETLRIGHLVFACAKEEEEQQSKR